MFHPDQNMRVMLRHICGGFHKNRISASRLRIELRTDSQNDLPMIKICRAADLCAEDPHQGHSRDLPIKKFLSPPLTVPDMQAVADQVV